LAEDHVVTLPVLIQQHDGRFSASLVGWPAVQAVRATRAEAIAALQGELAAKVAAGELLDVKVQPLGVAGLAGKFAGDAALVEISDEIYRQRDAERPQ
jgi:hypothetical protein